MKAKHTPGPWVTKSEYPEEHDFPIYSGDYDGKHTLIAEAFGSVDGKGGFKEMSIPIIPEAEANANIMAAAPEMLDALNSIRVLIDESIIVRDISKDADFDYFVKQGVQITNAIALMNNAILKATS